MTLAQWLPPDPALPTRDALLDCAHVTARLRAWLDLPQSVSLVRRRAKYRFGESLRLVLTARVGANVLTIAARTAREGSARARALGTHFDPELHAAFSLLRNDRRLPALTELSPGSPALLQLVGRVARVDLMAYAPEKSATLRCADERGEAVAFVKAYGDAQGDASLAVLRALAGQPARRFAIPRALGLDSQRRVLALSPMGGERLDALPPARRAVAFARLGEALASLHALPPIANLRTFPRLGRERIANATELLAQVRPALAQSLTALRDRLVALAPEPDGGVMLHGDVHAKNALLDGATIALIDFDQAARGDAACDLGSFLASLECERIVWDAHTPAGADRDAFLDGYASVRSLPAASRLRWHTAAALLAERGVRALSRLRERSLARLPEIVSAADRALDAR